MSNFRKLAAGGLLFFLFFAPIASHASKLSDDVAKVTDAIAQVQALQKKTPTSSDIIPSLQKAVSLQLQVLQDAKLAPSLSVKVASDNPSSVNIIAKKDADSDPARLLSFDITNTGGTAITLDSINLTGKLAAKSKSSLKGMVHSASLSLGSANVGGIMDANDLTFTKLKRTLVPGEKVNAAVKVVLYGQSGHFAATGETISLSITAAGIQASASTSNTAVEKTGSVTGAVFPIGVVLGTNPAVTVDAVSTSAVGIASSTGSYGITFKVTAQGGTIYIPNKMAVGTTSDNAALGVIAMVKGTPAFSGNLSSALSANRIAQGGYVAIKDGESVNFTANVTMTPIPPVTNTRYGIVVSQLKFNTSAAAPTKSVSMSIGTDALMYNGTSTPTKVIAVDGVKSGLASAFAAVGSAVSAVAGAISSFFGD